MNMNLLKKFKHIRSGAKKKTNISMSGEEIKKWETFWSKFKFNYIFIITR